MSKYLDFFNKYLHKLLQKGAFHVIFGNFLTKFVSIFGSVFLVRILSKESYGLLGYIENIYGYLHIFIGAGLGNSILRYVVLGRSINEKYSFYRFSLNNGSIFNLILTIVAVVVLAFFPHPVQFESARWIILVYLLILPFQYLVETSNFALRAMFANRLYAVMAFLVTTTIVTSRYFSAKIWGMQGIVIGNFIVYLLLAILMITLLNRRYFSKSVSTKLTSRKKKEVTIYSLQYMITNGIWIMFMLNGTFLLSQIQGNPYLIAEYKVANVLPANLAIVSSSIGVFVAPYFVKNELNFEWVRDNFIKTIITTSIIVGGLAIFLFIFSQPIIRYLYGVNYLNTLPIMHLLLVESFINCTFRFTTANLLAAMGQIKYNMIISGLGLLIQIVLGSLLIPKHGIFGLVYSNIFVYSFMSIALFFVFQSKYKIIKFTR